MRYEAQLGLIILRSNFFFMVKKIGIFVGVILVVVAIGHLVFTKSAAHDSGALRESEESTKVEELSDVDPFAIREESEVGTDGAVQAGVSATPQNDANQKIMTAILQTNKGDITIEFLDKQAPNTVANFVKLATRGFYDEVKFHRVIKGFMIQGGDPLTKDDTKKDYWGTGGPGYQFDDEISATNRNDVGTISMANAGPDTNGSQFFINVGANNFLDGKHTVFGRVTKGMDIVTAISLVATDAKDRPIDPVIIKSIDLK